MKFTKLGCFASFALEVVKFNLFKVFVSTNKKYLIISGLNKNLTEYGNFKITKELVKLISNKKYEGYKIYAHNFHSFDSLFLLKYLVKLGECKPILHEGKLISLNFKGLGMKKSLTFKDSFLLLPSSLKKLSESFGINNPKGIFPILFPNINYKGKVPDIKYLKFLWMNILIIKIHLKERIGILKMNLLNIVYLIVFHYIK